MFIVFLVLFSGFYDNGDSKEEIFKVILQHFKQVSLVGVYGRDYEVQFCLLVAALRHLLKG